MKIRFTAPSKTFLSGEYAVLADGPALVLCTGPNFELVATRQEVASESVKLNGIPVGSPAAKWVGQRAALLRDWALEFIDPHQGLGGFGASSAQFLFVHSLTTLLQVSVARAVEGLDLKDLWQDFKALASGDPSGADLVAQAVGEVASFNSGAVQSSPWPFPELDFAILRTNFKAPTHTHLSTLEREPLRPLVIPARTCAETFQSGDVEKFLISMRAFARGLRGLNMQTETTLKIIEHFEKQPWCKLAKGCGALGADTVLLFFAAADREAARASIASYGLPVSAMSADIAPGLRMDWSWR